MSGTVRTVAGVALALIVFSVDVPAGGQEAGTEERGGQGAVSPPAQRITVDSVRGTARYGRNGQFRDLTTQSEPAPGDTLVLEAGSVAKIHIRNPASNAVQSAVVIRGYTELTVAEAYQRGELSRTQLDVPLGNVSVGVRRTATPPSFNVRTPRVVVGVRGTEIHTFVVSGDGHGDKIEVGRTGVVAARDLWNREYSAGPTQGTMARNNGDARNNPLMRPIDYNQHKNRLLLNGPWRDGLEPYFDLYTFEPYLINPGSPGDSAGDPAYDMRRNAGRPYTLRVPPCCGTPPSQGK